MSYTIRGSNDSDRFDPQDTPYEHREFIVYLYSGDDEYVSRRGVSSLVFAGPGRDLIAVPTDGNIVYGNQGNDTLSGFGSSNVTGAKTPETPLGRNYF